MPVNKGITICTPSIYLVVSPCHLITYLVSDAGTVKGYRVATIILVRKQECVLLPSLLLFYRYLYRCRIASYAIAMASSFPYTSSSHASIQFSIWFGIRFYGTSQSRLPLFDTLRRRTSFYDCFAIASFFFSYTTRALYEDEHESDTPFWHETRAD
jgi:hypothetical protein